MSNEDTTYVDLCYPRNRSVKFIQIGLMDVRAADDIRIAYDFERDGWSIQQASKFAWAYDEPIDHDWQEVAFVEAWAREHTIEPEEPEWFPNEGDRQWWREKHKV